jgi:hypothetical protein
VSEGEREGERERGGAGGGGGGGRGGLCGGVGGRDGGGGHGLLKGFRCICESLELVQLGLQRLDLCEEIVLARLNA